MRSAALLAAALALVAAIPDRWFDRWQGEYRRTRRSEPRLTPADLLAARTARELWRDAHAKGSAAMLRRNALALLAEQEAHDRLRDGSDNPFADAERRWSDRMRGAA